MTDKCWRRCNTGDEQALFGDSAYTRQADKRQARRDGFYYGLSDRGYRKHPLSASQKKRNRRHSRIRAKVEHPFRVIKHLWGHRKLRYKGLAKNAGAVHNVVCAVQHIFLPASPARGSLTKASPP